MRKWLLASALLVPVTLAAQCSSSQIASGTNSGGQYVVYMPPTSCYNGDFIFFAHGYVQPGSPAGSWQSQLMLPDGTNLPSLINSAGFGFAASGYSKDGLAILQGIQDTAGLIGVIQGLGIPVKKYFATGASEGGLIAARLVEDNPMFDGGVAVCGPVGSFQKQLDYFQDARVLFDYFFPGVLPGSPIHIPANLMDKWNSVYEPAVVAALNAHPAKTLELINTAGIAVGTSESNAVNSITDVLWYNVFATTDAEKTLGGNPYGNLTRIYSGSSDDIRLNATVARFAENPIARFMAHKYETKGVLKVPLVTLHTTFDPIVPYWQEPLYGLKVQERGDSKELKQVASTNYGHCNINESDAVTALLDLILAAGL